MLSLLSFAQVYSVLLSFSQFCSVLHSFAQSICTQVCSVCSVLLNSAQFRSVLHSFVQSCSVSLSFAQIIFTQVCLVRSASLYCLSMCVYTLLPTLSMKFFGLISLVAFICLHFSSIVIQFRVLDGRGPVPPPPPRCSGRRMHLALQPRRPRRVSRSCAVYVWVLVR